MHSAEPKPLMKCYARPSRYALSTPLVCTCLQTRPWNSSWIQCPIEDAEVCLQVAPGLDKWWYNLPTADEVVVILPGSQSKAPCDIILQNWDGPLYQISDLHPAYAPSSICPCFLGVKMGGILTWFCMRVLNSMKTGSSKHNSGGKSRINVACTTIRQSANTWNSRITALDTLLLCCLSNSFLPLRI